jgi:molecular chaperone DnaK (HSP70)
METPDIPANPEPITPAPEETATSESSNWQQATAHDEAVGEETPGEAPPPGPALKVYDQCLMESVGIEANGDFFLAMVHAGAPLGTFGGMFFSTSDDNQSEIRLKVFAGTNSYISRNRPLGTYVVMGVPPASGGEPRIEVQFTAAEDGTLEVTARDHATRQELYVQYTPSEISESGE